MNSRLQRHEVRLRGLPKIETSQFPGAVRDVPKGDTCHTFDQKFSNWKKYYTCNNWIGQAGTSVLPKQSAKADFAPLQPRIHSPVQACRTVRAVHHPGVTCVLAILFGLLLAGCSGKSPPSPTPPSTPSTAPAAPGIFRDVAQEAGLTFRWGHGGKSPLTIIETLGHGCAFLDYDQDGLLDIFLAGNPRCTLYRNTGEGRFTDVTAESGIAAEGLFFGVAVGDYDNDSFPDLYLTGYGKCVLYHNQGKGKREKGKVGEGSSPTPYFEDVTAKAGVGARGPYDVVTAAAFVDLDQDGRLDLFAGRYIVFTPESIQYCTYSGVKAGCGVKNYEGDFPHVYRNLGGDKFAERTKEWGFDKSHGKCLGVAVRGLDSGKGILVYVANDEEPGELFIPRGTSYVDLGQPSGTGFNNGLTQAGMGVDWGDVNNDGKSDLVIATFQGEAKTLYRNDGSDLYTEQSGPLGIVGSTTQMLAWTARFFDYDNDGWLDLFFTNGHVQDNVNQIDGSRSYPQLLQLFHNETGRLFREEAQAGPSFKTPVVGRGAAFGDYDNDGRVDVLVVDSEGSPLLLHNESKSGHRWLGVRLVGVKCNRDGIGARVEVTADGKTFVREQKSSGGYLSSHDSRIHFGLDKASHIEKVVVRWPDGQVDTVQNVESDRYITITQGKG